MKLIARIIAETGVRDMFALLHAVIRKHGQQAATVRLRNQWVTVDPRNWKTRDDMTINVGLGTGGKAERFAQTMAIINVQKEMLAGGKTNLVSDHNLYNSAAEVVKLVELKNVDEFFTDPKTQAPPQPRPDPKLMQIQTQAQLDAQQAQGQLAMQTVRRSATLRWRSRASSSTGRWRCCSTSWRCAISSSSTPTAIAAATSGRAAGSGGRGGCGNRGDRDGAPNGNVAPLVAHLTGLMQQMNAPKRVVRDAQGRVAGVEPVRRRCDVAADAAAGGNRSVGARCPAASDGHHTWRIRAGPENISSWFRMVEFIPIDDDPFAQ